MASSPALTSPIVVPHPVPAVQNGRFRFRSDASRVENGTEASVMTVAGDRNTTGLPRYLGGDAVISAGQRVRTAMGGGGNGQLRGRGGGEDPMRFASAIEQQKQQQQGKAAVGAGPGSKNLQWTYFDSENPPPWMSPPWSAAQPGRDTPYVAPSMDPVHNPQVVP